MFELCVRVCAGVYGFTLDPLVGEFVMSHPDIKIPETGKIYSFNEGNYQMWDDATKAYMDSLKMPDLWGGTPYSVRASLVLLSSLLEFFSSVFLQQCLFIRGCCPALQCQ